MSKRSKNFGKQKIWRATFFANKKLLLILSMAALLILLIILAGCSSGTDTSENQIATQTHDLCENIPKPGERDSNEVLWKEYEYNIAQAGCYTDLAHKEKDVGFCDKIDDNLKKWECYAEIGIELEDEKICGKITRLKIYQRSREWCYEQIAKNTGNVDLCEKAGDKYNVWECQAGAVRNIEDQKVCENIPSEKGRAFSARINCYGAIASSLENVDFCDALPMEMRWGCYTMSATGPEDTEICERIPHSVADSGGSHHYSLCYRNIARNTGDISWCDKTTEPSWKFQCFKEVISKPDDINFCEKIPEDGDTGSFYYPKCYESAAYSMGNISWCDKIDKYDEQGTCYSNLASKAEDAERCEQSGLESSNCYFNISRNTGDISWCDKIGRDGLRWDCYGEVANKPEHEEKCDQIPNRFPNGFNSYQCYTNIASSTQDDTWCAKMDGQKDHLGSYKKRCEKQVAKELKDPARCDAASVDEWDKWYCYARTASEPEDAGICEQIPPDKDYLTLSARDTCYENIAKNTKESNWCDEILVSRIKERCYAEIGQ
jgi:hypothetical protein